MAGLGFKDFQVGEVLTSSDVDGYLMQQSVMRFADSAARGSALGTAVGTSVPLAEGMLSYLSDTDTVDFYDGSVWVSLSAGYAFSQRVVYTANATWTKADYSRLKAVRVTCVGGGGGGGGGTNTDDRMGGGGGGGALAQSFILAASLGATETVTVGAGGTGGIANTTGGAGNGSDGTDSSFGTAVVADGGYGGISQVTGYSSQADGGLVASCTGDFKVAGGPGTRGLSSGGDKAWPAAGMGGDSPLGFGGKARIGADPSAEGGLYGGGGGGGGQHTGAVHQPGSDGGDGVVIVDVFV